MTEADRRMVTDPTSAVSKFMLEKFRRANPDIATRMADTTPISDEERADLLRRMHMAQLTAAACQDIISGRWSEFDIEEVTRDYDDEG